MLRTTKNRKPTGQSKKQRGQILIIVAFAIIGLVAFVGLVVDTGLVFIGYGTLRRSVDAAALAAAAQYRKNPNPSGLEKAAKEFLVLNNVPNAGASVHVCNENYPFYHDANLCTQPARRRLVRVDASTVVPLAFLPVIGINSIPLNATATSEAASLDIILALDMSESMTWENPDTSLMRDPSECNAARDPYDGTSTCLPLHNIQEAALDFVAGPMNPVTHVRDGSLGSGLISSSNDYDRVAVIPFSRDIGDTPGVGLTYDLPLHLDAKGTLSPSAYRATLMNAISNLDVYQASDTLAAGPSADGSCLLGTVAHQPCRYYIPDDQLTSTNCGFDAVVHAATGGYDFSNRACFTPVPAGSPIVGSFVDATNPDPNTNHYERAFTIFTCDDNLPTDRRYCGTSNIGGAFWAAGQEFVGKLGIGSNPHPNSFRQESLWVVIVLTDGVANHANGNLYCPDGENSSEHWCQDFGPGAVSTRHCLPAGDPLYAGFPALANSCVQAPATPFPSPVNSAAFDADDYARAMADYVALGQQALIFTIGYDTSGLLGHNSPGNDYGEQLLNYAADIGDDGKINSVGLNPDYFYYDPANVSQSLSSIFSAITDQIATRLQK